MIIIYVCILLFVFYNTNWMQIFAHQEEQNEEEARKRDSGFNYETD